MSVLVQKEAPPFTATAIMPDDAISEGFSLQKFRGRYVALFFYPLDFTFVCPSEILAFDRRLDEFRARDCEVIGVSVDSHFTHLAWKNTPVEKGGIGAVRFPLVSDLTKQIARDYGILSDEGVALRGTFLIDKDGVVRHQIVNDLDLGRNIDDVLRTLDALQHSERSGDVCPANWEKGKQAMKPTPAGVKKYLKDFGLEL
jgi:peroxiredoxin (alkyl hydroperoxide reductase subunit C)